MDDFARDNNIKPESIKKAYKRFQVRNRISFRVGQILSHSVDLCS